MSRLTKATYVYWLLVMVNFISVMFDVSLYLLITSYISKKNLSLYLLQQLQVMPGNFRLLFWVVFVLFGYLVTVIYLRRTSVIGRKFGNHSCVKSQERHAGNNVQFCASGLFFEGVAPHKTFVDGWGKAKKNFSQSKKIEITLGSGQRCVFTVHGIFRCHKNPPFK